MSATNLGPIETVDYHTAGEPFRIVPHPPVAIEGATVAERRQAAQRHGAAADELRRMLCFEPRGHADMYGGLIVPPDDDGADLGVLFWHKDGFSTACGHGTIALGVWAVHDGLVPVDPSGTTDVRIDVPSGRVTARVHTDPGASGRPRVTAVDFVNVPGFVLGRHVELTIDVSGHSAVAANRAETLDVAVDVAYGGAIYAHLPASAVGLEVTPDHYTELIAVGRAVKATLSDSDLARHPTDDRLSGIYGTIIYDDLGLTADGHLHQRNITVFADGEVDRSPCGSGTASRLAVLGDDGLLTADNGRLLVHDSIVGTRFTSRIIDHVVDESTTPVRKAHVPEVTGNAHRTGCHSFELDPDDSLGAGFVLR